MNRSDFLKYYANYIRHAKKEVFSIETTYRCPLECPFCQRQDNNVEKTKIMIDKCDDITMENLKKITDFSEFVCFCGQISDPIYHANFLSLLEHVSKIKDKKFSINTNGTRKKIEWWKRAFEMTKDNVKWVFGLDGTDQETANIHRVNTRFDEVMEVMKLGASMGCYIEWQFIVFRHNEHQLELAKSMAKEIGVDLNVRISGRWLDSYVEKHKIYPPSDKWTSMNGISKKIIFTYRNKNVL